MAEQVVRWLGHNDVVYETEYEADVSFQLVELERKLYDSACFSAAAARDAAHYFYTAFRAAGKDQLLFEVLDCRVPE